MPIHEKNVASWWRQNFPCAPIETRDAPRVGVMRPPAARHRVLSWRKRMPIHEKHFRDLGPGDLVTTWDLASLRGWIYPEFSATWDLANLRVGI